MTLFLELAPNDVRRLRRAARRKPGGGFGDLAAVIVASAHECSDGTAWAVLENFAHVRRFVNQRERGSGGYQRNLRRLRAYLTDEGVTLTEWREISEAVARADAPHCGRQLSFELSA